jgi:FixJ family two-component response regulator
MSGVTHTIAVVDDDIRVLESLENLLESAGYAVRLYASGPALIYAGLSDVDGLIADIGMPGMNGFELHDLVKRSRPQLPVFLITGRQETGDDQRASARGVAGFFQKPFDGPALLAGVAQALRT